MSRDRLQQTVVVEDHAQLVVLDGGGESISVRETRQLRRLTRSLRKVSDGESEMLCRLVETFIEEGYLQRARQFDVAPIKIMAEVISGWDPDGVYEFARAFTRRRPNNRSSS